MPDVVFRECAYQKSEKILTKWIGIEAEREYLDIQEYPEEDLKAKIRSKLEKEVAEAGIEFIASTSEAFNAEDMIHRSVNRLPPFSQGTSQANGNQGNKRLCEKGARDYFIGSSILHFISENPSTDYNVFLCGDKRFVEYINSENNDIICVNDIDTLESQFHALCEEGVLELLRKLGNSLEKAFYSVENIDPGWTTEKGIMIELKDKVDKLISAELKKSPLGHLAGEIVEYSILPTMYSTHHGDEYQWKTTIRYFTRAKTQYPSLFGSSYIREVLNDGMLKIESEPLSYTDGYIDVTITWSSKLNNNQIVSSSSAGAEISCFSVWDNNSRNWIPGLADHSLPGHWSRYNIDIP